MNRRRLVHIFCSLSLALQLTPACFAAQGQPELNFKIYSPSPEPSDGASASDKPAKSDSDSSAATSPAQPASSDKNPVDSLWNSDPTSKTDKSAEKPAPSGSMSEDAPAATPAAATPPAADTEKTDTTSVKTTDESGDAAKDSATAKTDKKTLQGYIRVVPSGTKVPIIMDTAVDSDTSQEGDEFAARTGEDLNIDGQTVVPAGSVIKGRLAQINAPKNMGRSGSVALKFDTVTTPDNRQIPLVANLVARGGVVHARRGMKDLAIDTGAVALPTLLGIGIGALAGHSSGGTSGTSSKISPTEGAMIGAGIGLAIGAVVLVIKKGHKIDVRPGDELKIELAEDLRMPM